MGSERTSLEQAGIVITLPVECPHSGYAPIKFAPAANDCFPPEVLDAAQSKGIRFGLILLKNSEIRNMRFSG